MLVWRGIDGYLANIHQNEELSKTCLAHRIYHVYACVWLPHQYWRYDSCAGQRVWHEQHRSRRIVGLFLSRLFSHAGAGRALDCPFRLPDLGWHRFVRNGHVPLAVRLDEHSGLGWLVSFGIGRYPGADIGRGKLDYRSMVPAEGTIARDCCNGSLDNVGSDPVSAVLFMVYRPLGMAADVPVVRRDGCVHGGLLDIFHPFHSGREPALFACRTRGDSLHRIDWSPEAIRAAESFSNQTLYHVADRRDRRYQKKTAAQQGPVVDHAVLFLFCIGVLRHYHLVAFLFRQRTRNGFDFHGLAGSSTLGWRIDRSTDRRLGSGPLAGGESLACDDLGQCSDIGKPVSVSCRADLACIDDWYATDFRAVCRTDPGRVHDLSHSIGK